MVVKMLTGLARGVYKLSEPLNKEIVNIKNKTIRDEEYNN